MLNELTLRFTLEDGSTVDETVSLDFSDVSSADMALLVREADLKDTFDITARVLQLRLSVDVSTDVLKDFLKELSEGQGVTLG